MEKKSDLYPIDKIQKMKVNNEKYLHHQRRLLNYFSSVRPLFVKGVLRFRSEKKGIMLSYYQSKMNGGVLAEILVPYQSETNEEKRGTVRLVQDFVINCYYEFERNGEAMKLRELSSLVGVSISSINEQLERILKKGRSCFISQY